MKDGMVGINGVILGGLATGLSIVIVLGSLLLAFTEGGQTTSMASVPTLESVEIFTPSAPKITPSAKPPTFTPTNTPPPTLTPTVVTSESAGINTCNPPAGWEPYSIKQSDTLNMLASSAGLTPQELADNNCLEESRLIPDTIIYLPPATLPIPPTTCGPPSNWVVYIVQPGDTLFKIAQRVNSTVSQLKYANCLSSNNIRTGQQLFVPYQPAPNPYPTQALPTQLPPSPSPTGVLPTQLPPSPTPTEILPTQPPPSPAPTEVLPTPLPPSTDPTEILPTQLPPSPTSTLTP